MKRFLRLSPAAAIILFAFLLRIWNLSLHELSGDEAFTITTWTQANSEDLTHRIGTIDPQPPIALLTITTWLRIAGSNEFSARLFSVLTSATLIATIYGLAKRLLDRKTALIATLICCINPYQIWQAQDIRPYAMWMAAAAFSTLLCIRLIYSKARPPAHYLAYTAAAILALGSFYLEVFNILAHNLLALLWLPKTKQNLLRWIAVQLTLLAVLFGFLSLTNLLSGAYKPTASHLDVLSIFPVLILGDTFPYTSITLAIFLTILPIFLSILLLRNQPAAPKLFILSFTPIISLAALTLVSNQAYFRARYIVPVLAPLLLITAATFTTKAILNRPIRALLLFSLITASFISLTTYHYNPAFAKSPPWRLVTALLTDNATPTDLVIQNYPDPAFPYYYHGSAPSITLPKSENPPHELTTNAVAVAAQTHRYIWFLPTPNTAWDRDQIVNSWLNDNLPFINEYWIGNTHIVQYGPSSPTLPDISHRLRAEFPQFRLDGWRISPQANSYQPASTITLQIFYTPINPSPIPLTFFIHLLPFNPYSQTLITQQDHPPQNISNYATMWPLDTLAREIFTFTIPPQTPDGEYILTFGAYDPTTTQRITPFSQTSSPEPDTAIITTITIK